MATTSLPTAWVEKIFTRLHGIYGREFWLQYATGAVDGRDPGIENAKIAWAEELGIFLNRPEAIAYALQNLPGRCPNSIQFRDICKAAPLTQERPHQLKREWTDEQLTSNKKRVRELLKVITNKMPV